MRLPAEERFAAAWDAADAEFGERMAAAFETSGPWRDRIRAALEAGLRFLAADAERARLYVADVNFAAADVRARRQAALARLGAMVDLGRGERRDPRRVPATIADGIVGGVWHRVQSLVGAGRVAELPDELPTLMYFVVLPYLGLEAAEEELRRPPCSPAASSGASTRHGGSPPGVSRSREPYHERFSTRSPGGIGLGGKR